MQNNITAKKQQQQIHIAYLKCNYIN